MSAIHRYIIRLQEQNVKLQEALAPFARADIAIGDEPGPFRFETAKGHRLIERDDLRRARIAAEAPTPVNTAEK